MFNNPFSILSERPSQGDQNKSTPSKITKSVTTEATDKPKKSQPKPSGAKNPGTVKKDLSNKDSTAEFGNVITEVPESNNVPRSKAKPRVSKSAKEKASHSRAGPGTGKKDFAKRGGARRGDWGKEDEAIKVTEDPAMGTAAAEFLPEEPQEEKIETVTLSEYRARQSPTNQIEAPTVRELTPRDTKFSVERQKAVNLSDQNFHSKKQKAKKSQSKESLEGSFSFAVSETQRKVRSPRPTQRRNNNGTSKPRRKSDTPSSSKRSDAPNVQDSSAFPSL